MRKTTDSTALARVPAVVSAIAALAALGSSVYLALEIADGFDTPVNLDGVERFGLAVLISATAAFTLSAVLLVLRRRAGCWIATAGAVAAIVAFLVVFQHYADQLGSSGP
ncbi:hypothetical protein H0B56_19810 [Haloechinothrix sp. YIM 98757]|uniref:Uncharacterized protein n=1 Tax=Haloechinothrix aidingensis TaxID=2752311 RepID=A0A838AF97_9PSEU|nr:hypothetical protein [Haloechinothrix aidingensis]MBA0127798.1 hypothetical protein [Haloechinothrix aidingensis]